MIGLPLAAGVAAAGAAAGLLGHGAFHPNSPLFGPVLGRGPRREPVLYLTFDDGPNPTATDAILETLREEDVPAAFFMVGRHVERYPEVALRVALAGHEIGNHTHTHRKLHLAGPARAGRELRVAHAAIERATARRPEWFRAPHGYRNPFVCAAARRLGYRTAGWTLGVWDSDRPGVEAIRRRVRAGLVPGAILLLHDGDGYDPLGDRSQTAAALPAIVRDCREAGYRFAPLAGALATSSDG